MKRLNISSWRFIPSLTTEAGLNIENMVNKSKKNMAYTMYIVDVKPEF